MPVQGGSKRTSTRSHISIARVYEEVGKDPHGRVLIDRLWPRGLAKAEAPFELWAKDVAPSTDLRKWYGHQPDLFDEFARRYRHELEEPAAAAGLQDLRSRASHELILLTATKELELSHATVLRSVLIER